MATGKQIKDLEAKIKQLQCCCDSAINTVETFANLPDASTIPEERIYIVESGPEAGIYVVIDGTWVLVGSSVVADATLIALAAYNTNGLLTQTAPDTFTGRTIVGTANEITVSQGNGVAGNPTLSLASGIDATKIGGGNVSSTEFDRINGLASNAQFQIDTLTTNKSDIGHTHTMSNITDLPVLASGTYEPTLGSIVNLDTNPTLREAQYMRVGNVVTVSGRIEGVDITAAGTTSIELSIPIPSSWGSSFQAAGTAVSENTGYDKGPSASITAGGAADEITIQWESGDENSRDWSYHYTYLVVA